MIPTVDGSEIWLTTWDVKNPVNIGINYQPTKPGEIAGFLNHQQYDSGSANNLGMLSRWGVS